MKLAEKLLSKLNEWNPTGSGRHDCTQPLNDSGWILHLTADRVDTLGCLVWEIRLLRPDATNISTPALKMRALKIADRATGLMESLHFIELDETRSEALLRSGTPAKKGATLAYYEVLLSGGHQVTLRRFVNNPEKTPRREQTAFALTHEAIAKLVEDLVRED